MGEALKKRLRWVKLTEFFIDNDIDNFSAFVDENLRTFNTRDINNLAKNINQNEFTKLRNLIDKLEPFYLYRGLIIYKDSKVR